MLRPNDIVPTRSPALPGFGRSVHPKTYENGIPAFAGK